MMSTTTTTNDDTKNSTSNIERMKEFYSIYDQGRYKNFDDEAKSIVKSFYDKNVKYDIGDGNTLGYDQLMEFNKQALDGNASFKLDKIESRKAVDGGEEEEEWIYSSGWMKFPKAGIDGNDDDDNHDQGNYIQSVSKFTEDGKFIYIKNVDKKSNEDVQKAMKVL